MLTDDTKALAVLAVADDVKPASREAVQQLHALGVTTVMLTGDNQRTATAIAAQVGITDARGDLLPEDKLTAVSDLVTNRGPVAMIGDGVNDAPALAHATVGLAMGGAGSDVALESADAVLMSDDLNKIPFAVCLARRTVRVVQANLAFSLAVIVFLVASIFLLQLKMPYGVVGHEGSTLLVALNGLRLLTTRAD